MLAAGLALCLPAARAESRLYSVRVPRATRVEAKVSHQLGWDVAVSFDPHTCEISCEYRRKGDWSLLLPPAVELVIYTDDGRRLLTTTVDPAGTRLPQLAGTAVRAANPLCLPGRGPAACAVTAARADSAPAPAQSGAWLPGAPPTPVCTNLPLRI